MITVIFMYLLKTTFKNTKKRLLFCPILISFVLYFLFYADKVTVIIKELNEKVIVFRKRVV